MAIQTSLVVLTNTNESSYIIARLLTNFSNLIKANLQQLTNKHRLPSVYLYYFIVTDHWFKSVICRWWITFFRWSDHPLLNILDTPRDQPAVVVGYWHFLGLYSLVKESLRNNIIVGEKVWFLYVI